MRKSINRMRKYSSTKIQASYENIKDFVNLTENTLKGGGPWEATGNLWDTTKTIAQGTNTVGELVAAGHCANESMTEFAKGHYFCCACSGVSAVCFLVGAGAGLTPNGFWVWKLATKTGCVGQGVTMLCRRITGGGI